MRRESSLKVLKGREGPPTSSTGDAVLPGWRASAVSNWLYDIATQTIAGFVVGGILLYSQHRMEKRLEQERRVLESQRELLGAALRMHQLVSWTFAGTGDGGRVASGWEQVNRAGADWTAIEAVREFPDDVLTVSRSTRDELNQDLLAIMAKSPLSGGETPERERRRWLDISERRPFELLEPLIAACKRIRA